MTVFKIILIFASAFCILVVGTCIFGHADEIVQQTCLFFLKTLNDGGMRRHSRDGHACQRVESWQRAMARRKNFRQL